MEAAKLVAGDSLLPNAPPPVKKLVLVNRFRSEKRLVLRPAFIFVLLLLLLVVPARSFFLFVILEELLLSMNESISGGFDLLFLLSSFKSCNT